MTDTARAVSRAATPGAADRARSPRRGRLSATQWTGLGFIAPLVAFLAIFLMVPIGRGIVLSTQEWTIRSFVTGEAPFVGLRNYADVLTNPVFPQIAWQTFLFVTVSLVFQYVLGLTLAVFFARRFPLSTTLRSLILLPWLLPLVVSATTWRWMFNQDFGIINSLLGGADIGWLTDTSVSLWAVIIANIWLGIPFNMTILYGGLQEIPEELYEAGALDGATGWRAFRHITWPMLRPVVTVVLVLGVVYTLKVLDVILGLTNGGPANSTQTISTFSYDMSFRQFDFGAGAALGNILIVISLVFAVVYLRLNRRAIDE